MQTEGFVRKNSNPMRHYGHPVQGGLSIKYRYVAVLQMPLHDKAVLEGFGQFVPLGHEFQSNTFPVWSQNVESAGIFLRPIQNILSQFFYVPSGNLLRNCKAHSDI